MIKKCEITMIIVLFLLGLALHYLILKLANFQKWKAAFTIFPTILICVVLAGCSKPTQQPTTIAHITPRNPVMLPPTWTPTPSVPPTTTPVRPATLTFTPLPSVTPLPSTLTPGPTSDTPTPTATPIITPTVDTNCYIFAIEEGVPIQPAPFYDPYRVHPTMSPTITYQATRIYPPYYELVLSDEPLGWVDNHQLTIASQGVGCNQLPADTRELTDFPGLCFFSASVEVKTYKDRFLNEPYQTIPATIPNILLLKYSDVFYTSSGDESSSFFVDASQVSTFGNCNRVPSTGVTITDGWLWSQPDGENGVQLQPISPGYRIYTQEGPVEGVKPPSSSDDGAWYLVLVSPTKNGVNGWVWSSQIFIE